MRLIAMLMIVLEHCLLATVLEEQIPLSITDNIAWFIESFTVCAVDLFFLLTGYYLKPSSRSSKRILWIWSETFFYSIIIYLVSVIVTDELNIKSLILYALPVTFKAYWYMQVYIILGLLLPFIAILIEQLSVKQHVYLCVVLFVFLSLHQSFIPTRYTLDTTQGYGLLWGCTMVITGSFLNRIKDRYIFLFSTLAYFTGYIFIAICMFISNYLIVRFDIAQGITSRGNFYAYNSITVFFQSICLFAFFICLSRRNMHNYIINVLGSSSLAVYLISSHPILLCSLWTDIFEMQKYMQYGVGVFFLVAVLLSIIVVVGCILIDIICKAVVSCAFLAIGERKL